MEELKPCPSCGKKCLAIDRDTGAVACMLCGMRAPNKDVWNRHATPENKALALFDRITESPEALAKFLRAIDIGKIQLDSCFCKSDCGNEDGCPHELQCIVNWLNQPYNHKPEESR